MKKNYLRMVRRAFRALRHRRLRNYPWWRKTTRPLFGRHLWVPCRDTVAAGLSIGLFFSMMPVPFQMFIAALIAMLFRANIPFAAAACWVTNPFTQVPVWLAQFRLGEWLRHSASVKMPRFLSNVEFQLPGAGTLNAASFVLGFISSGVILALVAWPLVHLFSLYFPHYLPISRKHRSHGHGRSGPPY